MSATAKGTFPEAAAKKLIDMLRGKTPFSRWEAITAALELSQYLTDLFGSDTAVQAKSVKAPRLSKKAVVDALAPFVDKKDAVTAKALPAWVLPLLLKLAQKWLENKS